MFVKNPNLGADLNLGDFTVTICHIGTELNVIRVHSISLSVKLMPLNPLMNNN